MFATMRLARSIGAAGLGLAILLVASAQAGAAKPQANRVRETAKPVWTLAMDGSRVAYASGTKIRVWNVATGATSVVKGRYASNNGAADSIAAEIAIAGNRVSWINRQWIGNTEAREGLYTASFGGTAHLRAHAYRYDREDPASITGSWIAGVVGSGKTLAVSRWNSKGTVTSNARLSLITPKGLKSIVTGAAAIVAESADKGHIAVLRDSAAWPFDTNQPLSPAPSAGIYSSTGKLLANVPLAPPGPDSTGIEIALSGNRLVVLTTALHEPSGPTTVTLQVYDWTTGNLLETWPVGITQYGGEVSFAVYGHLAAVEGPFRLHLVDLEAGKDVTLARSSHTDSPPAIGPRGLVYALDPHFNGPAKLVFVPMAKLLAQLS